MDSLDRRDPRRRARAPTTTCSPTWWRLLVSDTTPGRATPTSTDGGIALLAATNRRTAARLLWAALADGTGRGARCTHITAANEWAIDVGMAARLELHQDGYLALRGMKPPAPYVHNGALL